MCHPHGRTDAAFIPSIHIYSNFSPSPPSLPSSPHPPPSPCPLTCLAALLTRLCHRSSLTYLLEDLFRHHLRLRKKDAAAPAVTSGLPVIDKFRVTSYFILGTISPAEHTLKVRNEGSSCFTRSEANRGSLKLKCPA